MRHHAGGKHYWPLRTGITGAAHFSKDCKRRYSLIREWDGPGRPLCVFVGLNPSTADLNHDDPTVRTCQLRAREWEFGRFVMLNLFAYRETSPARMWAAEQAGANIVGDNDRHLKCWAEAAHASRGEHRLDQGGMVIAAWGAAGGKRLDRVKHVVSILTAYGPIYCLDTTETGDPRHPRAVPRAAEPRIWRERFKAY